MAIFLDKWVTCVKVWYAQPPRLIDSRQMTTTPRSSPDGKGLVPVFTGSREGVTSTALDINFPCSEQKVPAAAPGSALCRTTRGSLKNGLYHNEDALRFHISMCGQIF